MANQSIGTVLYTIYHTCMVKIDEVLKFYYSADEFFKEATYELENKFLQDKNRMEQALTQSRDPYFKAICEKYINESLAIMSSLDHSRRNLLCKLSLVYVVGLFEAFFTDSVEQLVSESQLNKFKNLSFKNQVSYLQNNIGIGIDESQVKILEIDEFFARRNLLLHCGGKVDKRYLDRVGYYPYKEGEEIPVDADYFRRAAYSFKELAGYLYRVFKAKTEGNYGTFT